MKSSFDKTSCIRTHNANSTKMLLTGYNSAMATCRDEKMNDLNA